MAPKESFATFEPGRKIIPMFTEPNVARIELARLPTPIDHLETLSREIGVNLHIKRDDLTGSALSGNKVRKLEYLLPHALALGADTVISCGGVQSNHCRATALAARRLGLDVELFLRGLEPDSPTEGNLFLDKLLGSVTHSLTAAEYMERNGIMHQRAEELQARGRQAYVIPEGGSNALGSLGYVRCMHEIVEQQKERGIAFDHLVCATGSGGTLAGLLAGAEIHGFSGRIWGVPVSGNAEIAARCVNRVLHDLRSSFFSDLKAHIPPENMLDGHVGSGYGRASDEDLERIRDLAIMTGLILDPVYTNKAFGGLLRLIRERTAAPDSAVLFVHTGGIFGLFPFAGRLEKLL